MYSHITLGVRDLERSGRFYDKLLEPLGLARRPVVPDGGPAALCWIAGKASLPRFYVYTPRDEQAPTVGNGSMVAFLALSEEIVREAYSAGLAHGGADEGPPGPRPRYGAGYFGAYLRDPDGNKIHVVHRGDVLLDIQHHPVAEKSHDRQ